MGILPIQNGEGRSSYVAKVNGLIDYWYGAGIAEAIESRGQARSRLNAMARDLSIDEFANGENLGLVRSKLNALIGASGIPSGADLYMDFLNGRYFGPTPTPTDTHATDILALSSTGYETFAPNVLPRTDRGLLTTVGRTNKCTNWNANPTDLTGVAKAGDAAATLTVVDDLAALQASGLFDDLLSEGEMSGDVYVLDNSAGATPARAHISGPVGNTNPHVMTAFVRGGSGGLAYYSGSYGGGDAFSPSPVYRKVSSVAAAPDAGTRTMVVHADPGQVVYFILNQLEEGSFATDPIITSGSAAARGGNRPVIDLTGRLGSVTAGATVIDLKVLRNDTTGFLFLLSNGTFSERYGLAQTSIGEIQEWHSTGGVTTQTGIVSGVTGRLFVAYAVADGYHRMEIIGLGDTGELSHALPPLDQKAYGSSGYSISTNMYGVTERDAMILGATDPAAAFAQAKALAQEWAAE